MQCSVPAVEPTLHQHVERTAVVLSTGVVLLLLRVDSIGKLSTTGDDVVVLVLLWVYHAMTGTLSTTDGVVIVFVLMLRVDSICNVSTANSRNGGGRQ
jgi:hypothetical protein